MIRILQRIDRALLLHHPTFWVTRIHVIIAISVVPIALSWIAGTAMASRLSSYAYRGLVHTGMAMALIVSGIGTLYWAYIQTRNQKVIPFSGRRWMFPLQAFCIVALNLGPVVMACAFDAHDPYVNGHLSDGYGLELAYWASLIGMEVAMVLSAFRGGISERNLAAIVGATLFGLLALVILSGVTLFLSVMLGRIALLLYAVITLGAWLWPSARLPTARLLMALFHVLTPSLPLMAVFVLEEVSNIRSFSEQYSFNYSTALVASVLGYAIISYPIEVRLARLRASPAP